MKKYLMTGIAALAMGGMFTSCSHDMSLYNGNQSEQVVNNYEQAFINTYGEPASNQTWGFGETVASTRGLTRAIIEDINDPFTNYGNTDSYYKTADDVPESAVTYSEFLNQDRWRREDWGGALDNNAAMNSDAEILIPEGEHTIKFTAGKHDFYVTGDAILNVPDFINAARIYVLPGKTFTLNMGNYINDLEIYVAANATLNYNSDKLYRQDGGAIIFNRGTVNLKKDNFEINQDAVFYNEGSLNGKNITSKPGDGHPSYFYNYGDIELSGKFQLNSCANFYNDGTFTVTGETELTQGNSQIWWINKGIYTTSDFKTAAWNGTMYNYCSMFVTGDALMQNGQFYQMNGSYLEANRGVFNNFQFVMANGSGVNIKSGSLWGRDGDDFRGTYDWPHQGFVAVDDDAKVWVRLGGENKILDHKGSAFHVEGANMTFGYENVKFYSTMHYWSGDWSNTVNNFANESTAESLAAAQSENSTWNLHNVTKIYTGDDFKEVTATPNTPNCGATWTPNDEGGSEGGETVEPVTEKIRVIAEDLNAKESKTFDEGSDFDFNDVVFDVYWTHIPGNDDKSTQEVKIKLMACGAEYSIYIGSDDDNIEIHKEFSKVNDRGITGRTYTINTKGARDYNCPEITLRPDSWSGTTIKQVAKSILVRVSKSGTLYELSADKGRAASKIAVGTDYEWCDEYQDINAKYYFQKYVGDPEAANKWNTWYKTLRPQE